MIPPLFCPVLSMLLQLSLLYSVLVPINRLFSLCYSCFFSFLLVEQSEGFSSRLFMPDSYRPTLDTLASKRGVLFYFPVLNVLNVGLLLFSILF